MAITNGNIGINKPISKVCTRCTVAENLERGDRKTVPGASNRKKQR